MEYIIDKDMNIKRVRLPWKLLLILLVLLGYSIYITREYLTQEPLIEYIHEEEEVVEEPLKNETVIMNDSVLLALLHKNGCVLENVAVAQARLESNIGKSNVGRNAKNMFGIVYHKCKHVAGKYGVYAKYKTYEDNIRCYIHIQDHYLRNIDGHYAEDKTYINKLRKLK